MKLPIVLNQSISCLAVLTFGIVSNVALCEENPSTNACAQRAKECFAKNEAARMQCFERAAQDASCDGTYLGSLIDKRWTLSSQNSSTTSAPALLGPQPIDNNCVINCDNQFLSVLINDADNREELNRINTCYNSCLKKSTIEIFRP